MRASSTGPKTLLFSLALFAFFVLERALLAMLMIGRRRCVVKDSRLLWYRLKFGVVAQAVSNALIKV